MNDDDMRLIGTCKLCAKEIRLDDNGFSDCDTGFGSYGYGFVHGECKKKALRQKAMWDSEREP